MKNSEYTRETFLQAYRELLYVTGELGLPEEVGKMIAQQLHSEKSIRRMISYLRHAHPRTMEEIADEMVAIMEDRQHWIEKKKAEESNAGYNAWLNSDLRYRMAEEEEE